MPDTIAASGYMPKNMTALERHVSYFTDKDGLLSVGSIKDAFQRLGFTSSTSIIKAVKIKIAGGIPEGGDPCGIHKAIHRSYTGVFDKDGNFDEKRFNSLRQWDVDNKGALTMENIKKMIKANKERDKTDGWLQSVIGAIGSKKEFKMVLLLAADTCFKNKDGEPKPAITFERLKKFYTGGPAIFLEAQKHYETHGKMFDPCSKV